MVGFEEYREVAETYDICIVRYRIDVRWVSLDRIQALYLSNHL